MRRNHWREHFKKQLFMARGKKRNLVEQVGQDGKYVPCFGSQRQQQGRQSKRRKESEELAGNCVEKGETQPDLYSSPSVHGSQASTATATQATTPGQEVSTGKQPGSSEPHEEIEEAALPDYCESRQLSGLSISTSPQLSRSPSASLTTPCQLHQYSPGNSQQSRANLATTPPCSPLTTDLPVPNEANSIKEMAVDSTNDVEERLVTVEDKEQEELKESFSANLPEDQAEEPAIEQCASQVSFLLDQAPGLSLPPDQSLDVLSMATSSATPTIPDLAPRNAGSAMVQGITTELAKLNATILKAKRELEAIRGYCSRNNFKGGLRRL